MGYRAKKGFMYKQQEKEFVETVFGENYDGWMDIE